MFGVRWGLNGTHPKRIEGDETGDKTLCGQDPSPSEGVIYLADLLPLPIPLHPTPLIHCFPHPWTLYQPPSPAPTSLQRRSQPGATKAFSPLLPCRHRSQASPGDASRVPSLISSRWAPRGAEGEACVPSPPLTLTPHRRFPCEGTQPWNPEGNQAQGKCFLRSSKPFRQKSDFTASTHSRCLHAAQSTPQAVAGSDTGGAYPVRNALYPWVLKCREDLAINEKRIK